MPQGTALQLFSQLAKDLTAGTAAQEVTQWLEQQGVATAVAEVVGEAIANPGTVALPQGTSVSLGDAVGAFLPAGVTLPSAWAAVDITALSFSASAATLSFSGAVSVPLAFANQSTTLDLTLSLASSTSGGTITGSLGGSLQMGGQELDAVMDLQSSTADGQEAVLSCTWKASAGETISLEGLCKSFGLQAPTLLDGLPDLGLTRVDLTLDVDSAAGQKVLIDAAYGGGSAFVLVDHATRGGSSDWVLVLGGELADQLADWPLVGSELGKLGSSLNLAAGGLLLVSTADYSGLQPPALADGSTPFGGFPVDVTDRFMAAGVLALPTTSGGTAAAHLGSIDAQDGRSPGSPSGQLLVTVALPEAKLTATLGERNLFGLFPLVDLSLEVAVDPAPTFSLCGSVTLHVGSDLDFTVALTLTDEAVTGSMDVKDSVPLVLPGLSGVPSVNVGELGGLMGIDFDKQEIIAGLMATFGFGSAAPPAGTPDASGFAGMLPNADGSGGGAPPVRPTPDQCAVVLGINDDAAVAPVPDLDLFLLSVADADLTAILGTVLPGVSTADLEDLLGDVKVTDLLLYWCDETPGGLVLPDGTACTSGFRFHGALDFWGSFQAWAELEVTTAGFTGDAAISPVSIGTLSNGSPVLSLTGTGAVAPDSDAANAGVEPGGPVLHVSTTASPYLQADWDATFFGEAGTTGTVTVAKDQFTFDLTVTAPGIDGALDCKVTNGWTHLQAGFQLSVDGTIEMPAVVGVQLPSITLKDACSLTMTLDVSGGGFDLSVGGSLTFQGETLTIPTLQLDASFTDLADLPETMLAHIADEAETIFKDGLGEAENLIVEYGDDAINYLEDVADDVKHFVEWVLGVHQKPEWLEDGAIVSGGIEYDVIHHSRRRHIPDTTTLAQLGGGGTPIGTLLSSIPQDDVQMPSRVNGTVVTRQGDNALFLILDDLDKSGAVVGASYRVNDPDAFKNAVAGVSNPPTWQPAPPAAEGDIDDIPEHSQLSQTCAIGVTAGGEIDAFVDGIRYPIPDVATLALLRSDFQKTRFLEQAAWDATPAGPGLPSLAPKNVVKAADDPTVYQIQDGGKLKSFKDMTSLEAYGYGAADIITINAPVSSLFEIGDHLSEKP